jgi:hypothetical protein
MSTSEHLTFQENPKHRLAVPHGQPEQARLVPLPSITLDSVYQRDLNAERVQAMVAHWDERLVGTLILSARAGNLYVVDGQHRLAAMRERHDTKVSAVILTDLSQKDEADLFVAYNRSRSALNEWDLFRAEIVAGRPDALGILSVFGQQHLTLSRKMSSPTNVSALGAVRRVYRLGGAVLLTKVLTTAKRYWVTESHVFGASNIYGLALFFYAFEQHPKYDPDRVEHVLQRVTPLLILRKAQEIAFVVNKGYAGSHVTEAIRVIYNDGLARKNQLGSIRFRRTRSMAGISPAEADAG